MGLMKKLSAALVASSLVFSLVGSAFAAYTPAAGETAGKRMQALKLVTGRGTDGDLALTSEITRAELVTIIVRAFGQEENAKLLKGSAVFTDTANHWASGNIAMAAALVEKAGGEPMGLPGGKFAPDDKLSAAQAVAFLMKFLGVKADASKAWPANYLDKAVEMNLITAEDKALLTPIVNQNAPRGLAFYLFDNAFYTYKLANGKTFYTQYVDPTGPVITLNAIDDTTIDSKVTVTGMVKDAVEVYVGTQKVTTDAAGNFTAEFALPEVKTEAYTITVTARDIAGNSSEASDKIVRMVGTASVIEATDITVAAGATAEVKVVVKDAKGNVVAAPVTGESTVGTFADGKFTAGKVAGTGTLTLKVGELSKEIKVTTTAGAVAKVVADKTSVAPGTIVTLSAQDEFGNAITGATFAQTSADAMLDGVTGKFMASKAGSYKVTATANGKTAEATIGVFGAASKVVVSAPAQVVGNSTTGVTGSLYTITGTVADANGNAITTGTAATQNLTLSLPTGFTLDASTTATQAAKDGLVTWKVVADRTAVGSIGTFVVDAAAIDGADNGKTNVEVIAQVATSVKLDAPTSNFIRSNTAASNVTADLSIVDQNGKRFLGAGQTISFSLTGPGTFTTSTLTAKTSGEMVYAGAVIPVTFNSLTGQTGAITLTATSAGLGTTTATVTAAIASSAKLIKVTADKTEGIAAQDTTTKGTINYTVQVTDANGVPVAQTGGFALKATVNTDSFGEILVGGVALAAKTWNLTTDAEGKATFAVTADNFVGALAVTVADNGSIGLTAQEVSVNWIAGTASQVELTKTAVNVAAANPTVTLTAQLKDASGNKVAKSGVKVTFTGNYSSAASDLVTLNGTAKTVDVLTDANGVATVNVSVLGYFNYAYTVTMASGTLTTNSTTITVTNAVAASISTSLRNSTDTLTLVSQEAGSRVLVKATVKDAAGRPIEGDNVTLTVAKNSAYTVTGGTINVGTFVPTTGITLPTAADGTVTFDLAPVKAGVFTFNLSDSNAATAVTHAVSMNITNKTVAAGAQAKVVVAEADTANTVAVTAGKLAGPYTLKLQDTYGNDLIATGAVTVTLTPSAAGPTGIRATADGIDAATLTIQPGTSQTTFYVMTGAASDYTVQFSGNYGGVALTTYTLSIDK